MRTKKLNLCLLIILLLIIIGFILFRVAKKTENTNLEKLYTFEGIVTKIMENSITVVPQKSEDCSLETYINNKNEIIITISDRNFNYSQLEEGNSVIIKYDGSIKESNPAQIVANSIISKKE